MADISIEEQGARAGNRYMLWALATINEQATSVECGFSAPIHAAMRRRARPLGSVF